MSNTEKLNFEKLNIKEWPEEDRPREKMMKQGAKSLSTAELFAILIGSGNTRESAVTLMQRILTDSNQLLSELSKRSVPELCRFKGIGAAKAVTIRAACELAARRMMEMQVGELRPQMVASKDIYDYFYPLMCDLPVEECWVLMLNQANRVIDRVRVSMGGLTAAVVDLRCVLREALLHRATAIVLIHNHPSGNPKPSAEDNNLTCRLVKAAKLLDIRVLDHLILCDGKYYSYADEDKI